MLVQEKLQRRLNRLEVKHQLRHSAESIEQMIFKEQPTSAVPRFLETVIQGAVRPPETVDELDQEKT